MKRSLIVTLSIALLAAGCYPAGPEYVEDVDVVYTNFDDKYDFQSQGTYAMPDKIVVDIDIEDGDTTYVYMKQIFADQILGAIEDKMESYGWSRINNPTITEPDVAIMPYAIKSTTYFWSYWYDWWYWGYWGWYYPPYWSVSSVTTGSMVLVMADPSAADNNPIGESPVVWTMIANGLFTSSYDISRVDDAIDQAFEQSPYLKLN